MNIFGLRDHLVEDYSSYVDSFIRIKDPRIEEHVRQALDEGALWPDPLIQLNPSFEPGETIDGLVEEGVLAGECANVFRVNKDSGDSGEALRLHRHQEEAIRTAREGHNYVLTTGTGSGKSLAYIVPAVDRVLRCGSGRGIQAIVVYPMNALANSQHGELEKFLSQGYPDGRGPVTFARYTGQETDEERQRIMADPPDILLTNYVMLELILTRSAERPLVRQAQGLKFLIFDELHTYRGRQGADVAFLIRRTRDLPESGESMQCVGTSATIAGGGSREDQQREIGDLASRLFGAEVRPENVIGETLRRATPGHHLGEPSFVRELTDRVAEEGRRPPLDYEGFVADPLSVWIEGTFGVATEPGGGRLVRATPQSLRGEDGAARKLAALTGLSEGRCERAIEEGLLASYSCEPDRVTRRPPFAFRLHQFVSRGDAVYASIEGEDQRYLTLKGQQYVPGDRSRVLLPLAFCRECGQEYYPVRAHDGPHGGREFGGRSISDTLDDGESEAGFLFFSTDRPWPDEDEEDFLARLPVDWLEEHRGQTRVRRDRRDYLPRAVTVAADGREAAEGLEGHYFPAPFRFCLHCGVSYAMTLRSDFTKLGSLGSEGRSTATTILSLSAVTGLRSSELPEEARKLLSFTDNRQDASLQAGHFNDFVEVAVLRSALYRAALEAGEEGLSHEVLTERVSDALNLPLEEYASNPQARFKALSDTQAALRDVLGYRLYRDLERGWRITSPNLEQCGLLEISYESLEELCEAEDIWEEAHPALSGATPETRRKVAQVLLDDMRRRLAIKVDYLDPDHQQRIVARSNQHLIPPWAMDENEAESLEYASILFPRPRRRGDVREHEYLSARSGFGQYLRRSSTFEDHGGRLDLEETARIIGELLAGLAEAGIVEAVAEPSGEEEVSGYQVKASAMRWLAGEGTEPFHDPIRTPERPSSSTTNEFFVELYRQRATAMGGLEAREHTAQVPYGVREEREGRFREARLPVMYCSPTMELGVDIAELNAVSLRNVPPTPANYAQRSGRAGRGGQPALVFTYCSIGSSHDQYFFKRPERMVAGAVTPPRIDLANEDLVRAHVQAIWLTETGQSLGRSLKDVLDVEGQEPTLEIREEVRQSLADEGARSKAHQRASRVLGSAAQELEGAPWYGEGWLEAVLSGIEQSFDRACQRWRNLYRAALDQQETQIKVIRDALRSQKDKDQARRLRAEAESQLELLTAESEASLSSDFYSYRYFASEGFLPGYSFPRLPISAFIPGSRRRHDREEFLQRPRFLAVSEFGPRAYVYHEGSRYLINRVILERDEQDVLTIRAKRCESCGYFHPITRENGGPDLCENCGAALGVQMSNLFRLQNVSTVRRDRINSDEEERQRLGYEVRTGVRFAERDGGMAAQKAVVEKDGESLAELTYGHAATLWRLNLGWTRRKDKEQLGFVLDTERGVWARSEQEEAADPQDPLSASTRRVIPYVEDRRNCMVLRLDGEFPPGVMASLQAALGNAIRLSYQLEDTELAAEPLPSPAERRLLLFYESAEGGAGALRRLADEPGALSAATKTALELCHFDPDTGEDLGRAPGAREDCEAACYDCLMSYTNQPDHPILDRKGIRDILLELAEAEVKTSPSGSTRAEHLERLRRLAGSDLELRWLEFIEQRDLRLPTHAQALVEEAGTRPDFSYGDGYNAAIYIDGPHHDYPHRRERDAQKTEAMEDLGYMVIRFGHEDDWEEILREYPYVFGSRG